ncbi:MAG: DUF134 domain-containing protein [Methanothrix sp.]|nr:DUF134 domain-containing protein [Methanothrix sp.]
MCPCRGRRRGRRWVSEVPPERCFLPPGCQAHEAICLTVEELEAVRLVDLLDLDQEEAALYMGVSRKAFWNDLMSARRKIATALVYGTGLRIEGGSFILRDSKGPMEEAVEAGRHEAELVERELLILRSRLDRLSQRIEAQKGAEIADEKRDGS